MNIFLANSFLAERLTASTKREFLSITTLFWTSAEKLSLIHPSATLLAKHMSSQQHLVHHHAASALVSPFSVDSVEPTTLLNHFDLSPFPFPNPLGWSCGHSFQDLHSPSFASQWCVEPLHSPWYRNSSDEVSRLHPKTLAWQEGAAWFPESQR